MTSLDRLGRVLTTLSSDSVASSQLWLPSSLARFFSSPVRSLLPVGFGDPFDLRVPQKEARRSAKSSLCSSQLNHLRAAHFLRPVSRGGL